MICFKISSPVGVILFSLVDIDLALLYLIADVDEHLFETTLILLLHVFKEGARVIDDVLEVKLVALWTCASIHLFEFDRFG